MNKKLQVQFVEGSRNDTECTDVTRYGGGRILGVTTIIAE